MPKHLSHDLNKLKKRILAYSAAIDANFQLAVVALERVDVAAAGTVIARDQELDRTEVEIEDDCLKILALHQPVATDLRYVVTVLKMNNDLERIGDFAVNVAKRAKRLARHDPIVMPPKLLQMANQAREMVSRALGALVERDSDEARQICRDDDQVDNLQRDLFGEIRDMLTNRPNEVNQWMQLLSIVRYLERVGDLATNIAEDVIYLVEGIVVRHRGPDADD